VFSCVMSSAPYVLSTFAMLRNGCLFVDGLGWIMKNGPMTRVRATGLASFLRSNNGEPLFNTAFARCTDVASAFPLTE